MIFPETASKGSLAANWAGAAVPGKISKRGSKSTIVAASFIRSLASPMIFALPLAVLTTAVTLHTAALPVLAGSAAYAIGELRGWRIGFEQKPENAKAF